MTSELELRGGWGGVPHGAVEALSGQEPHVMGKPNI